MNPLGHQELLAVLIAQINVKHWLLVGLAQRIAFASQKATRLVQEWVDLPGSVVEPLLYRVNHTIAIDRD